MISYLGLTESNALINPLLGLGGGTKGKSNLGGNQSGLHKEGVSSHKGRKGKLLFVLDCVCVCVCVCVCLCREERDEGEYLAIQK